MVATISVIQKTEDSTAYHEENGLNRKQESKPKRKWWTVVRLVTCLLCVVPASMQLVALYRQHYAPYRSTVELNIEYPDNVSFPAITICNRYNVKFLEFCKKHPELCKTGAQLHNKNILVELNNSEVRSFAKNASLAEMVAVGQQEEDLIKNCMVLSNRYECGNARRIFFHPMINCFTLFSHWGKEDYRLYGSYKTDVWIRLDFQTGEFADISDIKTVGKVIVHDPNVVPNPLISGHEISGGQIHKILLRKMTHVRLPPPFETNCIRYNTSVTPSQSLCYSKCLETIYKFKYGCVLSPAPQPEVNHLKPCTGPEKQKEKARKAIEKECDSQCGLACREDMYEVNIDSQRVPAYNEDYDTQDFQFKSDLWIHFETNAHEIYSHKPKTGACKSWTHDSVLILWGMLLLLFLVGAMTSAGQLCFSGKRNRQ